MAKKKIKKVRVRKLTERECFRLMGLRDAEIDKLVNSGISRGQLYKMAGNSIVVNVVENIFRTLLVEPNSEKGHADALF
jgi:DNA (cytosine-5)-methyltransferase 1